MKKLLLLLIPVFAATGLVNAQNEGYKWYFSGTSPYSPLPAIQGSAGTHQLTTIGTGTIVDLPGETVGLGDCSTPIDVGQFTQPVGLQFSNSPQLITNTYTIEMVVNFATIPNNLVRLMDFSGGDDGVYIHYNGDGIDYFIGTDNVVPTTIAANTWYDLVFVRNAATQVVSFYQDGVLVGTFNDLTDALVPQVGNGNIITFLKDDGTEYSDGKIAKISIYNRMLSPIEIQNGFNNICNTGFLYYPPNFSRQGYQWTFASGTPPFASTGTDGNSTGSYPLTALGTGTISAAPNTAVGLGASCVGNIDVSQYTRPFGLEVNIANTAPQFVDSTYTIELDLKTGDLMNQVRLAGFNDGSDDGIYLDALGGTAGAIIFIENGNFHFVSPLALTANTWYSFIFTRDAATKDINSYVNTGLIGTYNDANDIFVAHESSGYNIRFLKDDVDNTQESDGQIAKAAVFNVVLTPVQIQERFDNICNSGLIALPVSLKNFTAQKVGKRVELSWTTSAEQNNLGFEVQRSADGTTYTAVGFVKGAGTSSTEITYHFTDPAPLNGKSYYRLKQVNFDNHFKLSDVRLIDFAKDIQDLQVYPNPAHSMITIVNIKAGNTLNVFDSFGRFVLSKKATNTEETIPVERLSTGVYTLQVIDGNGSKRSIRFTRL